MTDSKKQDRYNRNRIYIQREEQLKIKDTPILIAGCGIGSVIAECALRFGFENLTLIDGDIVELTNISRQNYTERDINISKVEALKHRLLSINNQANIQTHDLYLTANQIESLFKDHQIAVNALDFTSDTPLRFDHICQKRNIPILHPYNIGWAGLLTIVMPNGAGLEILRKENKSFTEVDFVEYVLNELNEIGKSPIWMQNILKSYLEEQEMIPPPQLAIGSWLVAAMCTTALYHLATKREIRSFPQFYFNTIKQENDLI